MSLGVGVLGVTPLGGGGAPSGTTASGTGSLTLSASGAVAAPASGTGSLSLSASGTTSSPASGSAALTLSATGSINGAIGSASLSLSATGTVSASTTGTGSLSLSATGSTTSPATGSASLSLSATGSTGLTASGSASLSLSGSGSLGSLTPYPNITEPFESATAGTSMSISNTTFPQVIDSGLVFATGGASGLCAAGSASSGVGGDLFDCDSSDTSHGVTADDWTVSSRIKFIDATSTPDTGYSVVIVNLGEVGRTPADWTSGATDSVQVKYDAGTKHLHLLSGATNLSVDISGNLNEWLDLVIVGTNGAVTTSVYDDTATLIDDQAFTVTADLYRARTQLSVYKDGPSTFEWRVDDVYMGVTTGGGSTTTTDLTSTAPSRGAEVVSETTGDTEFELSVEVLDKIIERPPSALTVVVAGGEPEQDVTFSLEPTGGGSADVYTVSLDSDGSLGPTSLGITVAIGGDVGVRTVTATQGSLNGADTYTVLRAASLGEVVQGLDATPIELSEAVVDGVRKWVFQDLLPAPNGGIGSYVFEINPTQMSSPQRDHQLTSRHSTAMNGNYHVFQAGNTPLEWTFSGFCPSEDMYEKLYVYSNLNRRFYIIDHHNRAWKSVITHLEIIPRLRTNYNGVESDWIQDYTITATIIDQDPVTPV